MRITFDPVIRLAQGPRLFSRKHWTRPEEDIRELRHGEFGDTTPSSKQSDHGKAPFQRR